MLVRIITGFVLAILAILASFVFPTWLFNVLCGVVFSLAAIEWSQFISPKPSRAACLVVALWLLVWLSMPIFDTVLLVALVWWVLVAIAMWLPMAKLAWIRNKVMLVISAFMLFVPAWVSAVKMHETSHLVIFAVLMFVCFADTGAYFIGSRFGKHKMCPKMSPKKTYEGLAGGLVIGLVAGMAMVALMPGMTWQHAMSWLILGFVVLVFGVIGDLFESLVKRVCAVKDSGTLLPGHGGVLDRIDSLCAALPFYAIGVLYFLN